MKRQKGIPPKVLERARRLSTEAKPAPEEAPPERPAATLVRRKIVAALKKLHPMD